MKKVIVTTTINHPTEAIQKFQAMKDWDLVVIGDKKTPRDYRLDRGIYVTPEEQEKYDPALSDAIGWNCIQRRSMGLLWAHDLKADIVAVVDDDNIPLEGWGENLLVGKDVEMDCYQTELPACGIAVIRFSFCRNETTRRRRARRYSWMCRRISGTATRILMRCAVWNTLQSASLRRWPFPCAQTKWVRSTRKTRFWQANA